jgi:hypothetical protein
LPARLGHVKPHFHRAALTPVAHGVADQVVEHRSHGLPRARRDEAVRANVGQFDATLRGFGGVFGQAIACRVGQIGFNPIIFHIRVQAGQ